MLSQRRLGLPGPVGRLVDAVKAAWSDLVSGRRRWRYLVAGARDRVTGRGRSARLAARSLGDGTWRRTRTLAVRTRRRLTALGSAVGGATAALRARSCDLLAAPSGRRTAIAAVAGMVVAGVILGATRLPGGDPSVEQGVVTSGQSDPDASRAAQRPRGPGLTRPGIHLSVSPLDSGDLEVVERVRVPAPVSTLPLAAPPPPPDAEGPTTRLVDLRVSADGQPVPVDGSTEVEQPRELALPRPATTIDLRYRVENADAEGDAAPQGRATLSLRPATSGALGSQPVVVQVRGAVVHTLVCVDEPRERQLCGVDGAGGWHTQPLTAATSGVLALVDLPAPQR
jgi:hypothetical protein